MLTILLQQKDWFSNMISTISMHFAIKCKTKHNFVSYSLTLMVHLTTGHVLMTGLDYRYNIPPCLIICGILLSVELDVCLRLCVDVVI